ncbi:hypothetical protein BD289DRAFT_372031 [Coniella lustricola]|uniref:FAD/NAD(P)-binding domain-containing protein n=1 Tax=Coniella lustricola TaxID=2025994 RepID=A0A2T3A324_9PEZI|nr:hypothetical protein BD289DRAFT_372031 [Coniella lustricola]
MSPNEVVLPQSPDPQPSSQRCEPGSINIPIAKWPKTKPFDSSSSSSSVDAVRIAHDLISQLNTHLSRSRDASRTTATASNVASLFHPDECYWRDHLALSWDLQTLKGRAKIAATLAAAAAATASSSSVFEDIAVDASTEYRKPKLSSLNPEQTSSGIVVYLTFATTVGRGRGLARLVHHETEGWKIWTLFTSLEELKGFEEPVGPRRAQGVAHGYHRGRKNWRDRRDEEVEFVNSEPDVLILGAGQAGLTAHARLKMLNVPALIVDANETVGDNWRNRYHQLVLHDPIWYDHLPYIPFPDWWPIFTPKDKLGDFFESYAKLLDLNVWTRSTVTSAVWDDDSKHWTVTVTRRRRRRLLLTDHQEPETETETRTLHPKHIIQSTGHSGKPNLPSIPGMQSFTGDFLGHSSAFCGAKPSSNDDNDHRAGKKAVVVGACNSAHDICQDYFEKGYDVTMVQRSSTCVVSSASICRINLAGMYEEGGPPTQDADLAAWATPAEVFKAVHHELTKVQQVHDGPTLDGLRNAGFALDRGPDDCGLVVKYFQRGGGYYIDVGASQLIIDGKIRVKHGVEIVEVTARGLRCSDGTELEADEVVFATGYQNMRTQARAIFGDAVANRLRDIWGFDQQGEFRALCRPSGHPGFWFHGGNLAVCRYYSRLLALQIKAELEGLAMKEKA